MIEKSEIKPNVKLIQENNATDMFPELFPVIQWC